MAELADALDLGSSGAIRVGSTPTTRTTSEQALYRLLRLFYKSQSALTPLLLLSKSQPLRWVVIWFWVQACKLQHLYCCDVPPGKGLEPSRAPGFFFFTGCRPRPMLSDFDRLLQKPGAQAG